MDFINQPWPWYVGGPLLVVVVFLLNYFGKNFGVSSNLETMCSIIGASKVSDYFKFNLKDRSWGIAVVLGVIIGGFLCANFFPVKQINLNPKTVIELNSLGFKNAGANSIFPSELFDLTNLSIKNIIILLIAGFCIGFGTRYAKGCTSGHAITGLSSLQLPSLFAVVGFFIGGLIMTWVIFPLIF